MPAAPAMTAPAPIAEILMNCLRVAIINRCLVVCSGSVQRRLCYPENHYAAEQRIYCFQSNSRTKMIFIINMTCLAMNCLLNVPARSIIRPPGRLQNFYYYYLNLPRNPTEWTIENLQHGFFACSGVVIFVFKKNISLAC